MTKYLTDKQVADRYSISRQTPWKWARESNFPWNWDRECNFPEPVKLSDNCTRWRLSDLEQWEKCKETNFELED